MGLNGKRAEVSPLQYVPAEGLNTPWIVFKFSIIFSHCCCVLKKRKVKFDKTDQMCILKKGGCIAGILRYAKITEVLYADRKQRKKTERA